MILSPDASLLCTALNPYSETEIHAAAPRLVRCAIVFCDCSSFAVGIVIFREIGSSSACGMVDDQWIYYVDSFPSVSVRTCSQILSFWVIAIASRAM